jgi:hypothetical protein
MEGQVTPWEACVLKDPSDPVKALQDSQAFANGRTALYTVETNRYSVSSGMMQFGGRIVWTSPCGSN